MIYLSRWLVRGIPLVALVAIAPSIAHADAMSDRKKAFRAHGIKVPHPAANCGSLTKAEASRYLGAPIGDGESAGSVAGCADRAVADPSDGVLVTRQSRSTWYPPTTTERLYRLRDRHRVRSERARGERRDERARRSP